MRMIETTATHIARNFHDFLGKVEHGETVIIRKHGQTVARMVPDTGFMSGKAAADIFRSHKGDPETADAITAEIRKLDQETADALDH
jgi:antitoxin (DNA-binding transcriptional repressor) of toxin-antitoxin stability system